MGAFTQANRPVRIATPLGDDVLLFESMIGTEQLGRPFQYELILCSEERDLDYKQIIGQAVTIEVDTGADEPRYFNGLISRFSQINYERKLCEYRATMVPWLWFLTRSSDCRIFQQMTIPAILKQVFDDHGYSEVVSRLHGTYKPWDYCVQYRETAFNFVSRLMEQEGICYFFEHGKDKHSLVLCDTPGSHAEFAGYEELYYRPSREGGSNHEILWNWVEQHEVQSGGYRVKDFDFKKPRREKISVASAEREHAVSELEQFEYLGEMDSESDGTRYSRLRLEQRQAQHEIYSGEGDARGICVGARFTLHAHPREDLNKEYLTTGNEFRIESAPFETAAGGGESVYVARLDAIPAEQEFRTPQVTRKPSIKGPQTAIVVGPLGEDIHTDKYGRVKVHFHWDHHGSTDEKASCWIRVAQIWAGKGWGSIHTPRVGQEVVVEFLEGDPDRPIITGRVYNELSLPPYELPAHKTISTNKSNSANGGLGFNEIRFEDKKGEEQVFVHAEKDEDVRIKNDAREWIGNERHLIVKKDQFEMVEGDKHGKVKGDDIAKVVGDAQLTVEANRLTEVKTNDNLIVGGDRAEKVAGDDSLKVEKNINQEARQKISIKSGMDFHGKAGMNYAMEAGMAIHIKGGMTVVIEGGVQLSLKVGGNFIDINPGGVFIQGTMVMINSGGAAGSGSGSSPTAPAAPEAAEVPKDPKEAATAEPGEVDDPPPALSPSSPTSYSSSALVLKQAAENGTPFCEECERSRAVAGTQGV